MRVSQVTKILPRLPDDLKLIVFKKKNKQGVEKDFVVRREKIETALYYLKNNNKYFCNIEISSKRIENLPLNGVIDDDKMNVIIEEDDSSKNNDVPTPQEINDLVGEKSSSVFPGIVTDTDNNIIDNEIMTRAKNTSKCNDTFEKLSWPKIEKNPINEFTHEGYINLAFPTLFPTGVAEF